MSTLAHENARADQLHHKLHRLNAILQEKVASDTPVEEAEKLQTLILGTKKKLKRCSLNQKAITGNIAAVNIRMQILEQHQWRKNQLQYSQMAQRAVPLEVLAEYGKFSIPFDPPSAFYHFPLPISPQTPLSSPAGLFPSLLTMTPSLQPQLLTAPASAWNTPLGTPYHEQFRFPSNQGPSICVSPPDTVDHLFSQMEQLHVPRDELATVHTRSMSLPNLCGLERMQF